MTISSPPDPPQTASKWLDQFERLWKMIGATGIFLACVLYWHAKRTGEWRQDLLAAQGRAERCCHADGGVPDARHPPDGRYGDRR